MNKISEDIQLQEIATIINNSDLNDIYNQGFKERLDSYSQALKMSFWVNHFDAHYMINSPYVNGKILDFGCGSGHIDVVVARHGYTVHGIDLSSAGIGIANYIKSLEDDNVKSNLSFSLEDVTSEPDVYHQYDCCMSTKVFEHILNPQDIIAGIGKRVKPGGFLIVSVPLGHAYDCESHVHHFADEKALENHFKPFIEVVIIEKDATNQVLRAVLKF